MSALLPTPYVHDTFPVSLIDVSTLTVRTLNVSDANAFRAIRLEALRNEGVLFGPTYEEEKKLTMAHWQERCAEVQGRCLFGLFNNSSPNAEAELIGIMSARKWEEDASGQTILCGLAYLKPEYRGKKFAASLYAMRESWSIQNQFKRAVFFIRQGNTRSAEIHEKRGAHFMYTKLMQWPGRPMAPWRWYEKRLTS